MKLNYHNEIKLKIGNKDYKFHNTMFNNIYQKIANFDTFFDKIAIGSGNNEIFSSNFKLGNFELSENLTIASIQTNPSNNEIFIQKNATINPENINVNYITEAGISSNLDDETNPDIYNYFSFISEDTPEGIDISSKEPIIITVTIYLSVISNSLGLLTTGENPFLNLILGNGCTEKNIYVARGDNLSNNEFISHPNTYVGEKYLCSFSHNITDNVLNLTFEGDLKTGETNEIVFILDNIVFARINTYVLQANDSITADFTSTNSYVIDLGLDVSSVESVYNNYLVKDETNYFVVKYANNFSTKTVLPFNNLFNNNTRRFLSLDGDKIFFILNDIIYMYQNINYKVEQVFAINLQIQNIFKLTAFDDFVFIFTQTSPCIHAYKIINNTLVQCSVDLSSFEHLSVLETFTHIDIVQGNNGTFMMGFIVPSSAITTAYTLFLTYNENTNTFTFDDYLTKGGYTLTFMLAFHKNNFSDAQFIYLQAGATSSKCRRVVHTIAKSASDGYNITAYYYTSATTSICVKSRAVVMEKSTTPNFWLYYYPQVYRFNLSEFSDAEKSYISTNLLYLIQKMKDGTYRAYNLVGYDNPEAFSKGMPPEIDESKILSVEFLIDTVLFFMDDEAEPIIAYNLNIVGTCVENVSTKNQSYTVNYNIKKTLGSPTKGVTAKLAVNINVWFFLTNLIKFLREQISLYLQHLILLLNFMF